MYATRQNKGKILARNQICDIGSRLSNVTYPCVCIYTHGCWRWQRLDKLSQNKFREHQDSISKQILKTMHIKEKINLLPIEILNETAELSLPDCLDLDGKWFPLDLS